MHLLVYVHESVYIHAASQQTKTFFIALHHDTCSVDLSEYFILYNMNAK